MQTQASLNAVAPGTVSPATLARLEPVADAPPQALAAVVAAARAAQAGWAEASLDARVAKLSQLAREILRRRDDVARIMSLETGRTPVECLMSEVVSVGEYAKGAACVAREALAPHTVRLSPLDYPGKRGKIELLPRGVVAIIAPWNYPLSNFFKSLFPALLAGNAVVLKPSEHTPRTGAWLAALCAEILPVGLVGVVHGARDVGAALLDAPIDAVVFTGSVPSGRRVALRAAEKLIPCSVELGGKDAAIVLADCDLDRTALGVAQWAFHNAGQNCAGIERVYVEDRIADAFVEKLARIAASLRVSDGVAPIADLGPLQNAAQLAIVEAHVADALERGAVIRAGGARTGHGYGYAPTVLDHCTHAMRVMREETFGPVVGITRVADCETALSLANDSPYGLNGSVWTRNLAVGEALARRLHVGVAHVNNHAFSGILPDAPWTGTGETGFGVAASRHGYHVFTRPRVVFIDAGTKPDPWWFPATDDLAEFAAALCERQLGNVLAVPKLLRILSKRIAASRDLARR